MCVCVWIVQNHVKNKEHFQLTSADASVVLCVCVCTRVYCLNFFIQHLNPVKLFLHDLINLVFVNLCRLTFLFSALAF